MKFCKDCKFCELDGEQYSKCDHPSLRLTEQTFSPVTGKSFGTWYAADGTSQTFKPFCKTVRTGTSAYLCGPEGKLFKPAILDQELARDEAIDARQERKEYRNERFNPDCDEFESEQGARE